MPSHIDQLLPLVHQYQSAYERAMVADALRDEGRDREAERVLVPGRILVRLVRGHWAVPRIERPLRRWGGVMGGDDLHQPMTIVWVQRGEREQDRTLLDIEPSFRLRRHSPTGFLWGYGGSGPAQLALAIMLDCCGQFHAERCYQTFKTHYVARWPQSGWMIDEEVVWRWADTCTIAMQRRAELADDAPPPL
jgi:Family of unknown function (DUF6166)